MARTAIAAVMLGLFCFSCAATRQDSGAKAVEALDPEFSKVVAADAALTQIPGEFQFTEGPVWIDSAGAVGCLLFSDIPADRIYRWQEGDTACTVWREPSGNSNGLILEGGGCLLACEHGNRRVSLTGPDGEVRSLCESYRGKKLNSPNDAVVGPDSSVWFTDPPYGLEGRPQEQDGNYVFRLKPGQSEPQVMVDNFDMPNGIVFSPDRKTLYIADSGEPHNIRSFSLEGDSLRESGGVFALVSPGAPDGMCVDREGRVYAACGDGVQVLGPAGKLLGKILTPLVPTNCTFGGPGFDQLFITAREKVYMIQLRVTGLR
ncbi:SMP-30/gluconolactonase/LRE family protein [bacterium]|nr:SMP-30/gluconolactonase/LRE family protein [bacterium]